METWVKDTLTQEFVQRAIDDMASRVNSLKGITPEQFVNLCQEERTIIKTALRMQARNDYYRKLGAITCAFKDQN